MTPKKRRPSRRSARKRGSSTRFFASYPKLPSQKTKASVLRIADLLQQIALRRPNYIPVIEKIFEDLLKGKRFDDPDDPLKRSD